MKITTSVAGICPGDRDQRHHGTLPKCNREEKWSLMPIPPRARWKKRIMRSPRVYGADLSDPILSARLRLALRMLNDAGHTKDDSTGKYALLLKARELAVELEISRRLSIAFKPWRRSTPSTARLGTGYAEQDRAEAGYDRRKRALWPHMDYSCFSNSPTQGAATNCRRSIH